MPGIDTVTIALWPGPSRSGRGPRSLPSHLRAAERGTTDARARDRTEHAVRGLDRQATEMLAELQTRGAAPAGQDRRPLALYWSSLTAGFAAHQIADPKVELQPALDLAARYAASAYKARGRRAKA